MKNEMINAAYTEISNFRNKFGENLFAAIMEEDNTTREMAKGIISVFSNCTTKNDFEIADNMLMAICGYNFEELVERIKKLDEDGYQWESC